MMKIFQEEKIYIAGPECFYEGGTEQLQAMKKSAEVCGFGVTLPNDHPLDMENPDLQKRADSIFADLETVMKETTVVIADLEAFRGAEADSGTIYELGMAYAKKARCYGYTRDKRSLSWKDQSYRLQRSDILDEHGAPAPYPDLPFAPSVVASTKIVEGDFNSCLRYLMTDIEEEVKRRGLEKIGILPVCADSKMETMQRAKTQRLRVYLSGPERYALDARSRYEKYKALGESLGLEILTPLDGLPELLQSCTAAAVSKASEAADPEQGSSILSALSENPYMRAAVMFKAWQRSIADCDVILADLNDYRGYECSNDVGFECGAAFQLGKKCFGYMSDTRRMRDRIPNHGDAEGFRDLNGANVENFDYPVNLMFASSMTILEGGAESALHRIAEIR